MSAIHFEADIDLHKIEDAITESNKIVGDYVRNVEKAGDAIDTTFVKVGDTVKSTADKIKDITDEMTSVYKEMMKAWGTGDVKTAEPLAARLSELRAKLEDATNAEKEFNAEHAEAIARNREMSQSTETLNGSIGKWALNLGGAAAILNILKSALLETTSGLNAFNIVGAVTKQVLYNIVTGSLNLTAGLSQVIVATKQINALRVQAKIATYEAKKEETQYNLALGEAHDQTRSVTERIKSYDDALAHHKKSVEIEITSTRAQMAAYMKLYEASPDNEKIKMTLLDLRNKIEDLKNSEASAIKEVFSMRSGLIKKDAEEQKAWREDLHNNLMKLADEQIEINGSIAEQERLLQEAVKDGSTAEVLAINNRIKVLQRELDIRINIAKAALIKNVGGAVTSISTSNITIPSLSVKPVLPGLQEASSQAQAGAGLATQKEWNVQDAENDEKKLKNKKELLRLTLSLTAELGRQLGMEDNVVKGFEAFDRLITGDYFGAAATMLSSLISMIPNQASKFKTQIDSINLALKEQQRLIENADIIGGGREAREQNLLILKQQEQIALNALHYAAAMGKPTTELLQNFLDAQAAYNDATKEFSNFFTGSITENSIGDAISQGFEDGKRSALDFADTFNNFMTTAINSALQEMSKPAIAEWYAKFAEDMASGGGLSDEEKANLKAQWDKIIAEGLANREAAYDVAGISPTIGTAAQPGLSGQIQRSITEETGQELSGLFRRFADDERLVRDYSKMGVEHLVGIEANTYGSWQELIKANTKLDQVVINTKPAYTATL